MKSSFKFSCGIKRILEKYLYPIHNELNNTNPKKLDTSGENDESIKIINFKLNYYTIVSILGILFCILWVCIVNTQPFSDFQYYNELANQIANGGAWGDTYTSVGYSIVLGFLYKIFGSSLVVAKTFNILLTLVNYIMLYNILRKVSLNKTICKLVYTLFVFFPPNIFYNSILATEILFTTIFLTITLVYYSNIKYKYVILGVLTAINTMIKPFFIVFFFVIFIVELMMNTDTIDILTHTCIILLTSIIVISPWIYRNTKLIGEFTLVSNNKGIVLYINNNSQNHYGRWMPAEEVENSVVLKKEYIQANMTQKNKFLTTAAKNWIKKHPIQFMELGFKRLYNTYFVGDDIGYSLNGTKLNNHLKLFLTKYTNLIRCLIFIPSIIVIFICSVQILISLFKNKSINSYDVYSIVCFYMFTCIYFVTEGQSRYSFPFIFIIIYFFSYLTGTIHRQILAKWRVNSQLSK